MDVHLAQKFGRLIAVADAKFPARAIAIGIDGSLRHPKFTRDLLGAQMLVDQTQAFALALGQKVDSGHHALEAHGGPGMLVNGAFAVSSTLTSRFTVATSGPR